MIFIGYSSQDRYTVVEPIIFHLKNYGIDVWYDFHDMFLSDSRYTINFEHGIKESNYVIFILSHNFFNSKCAVEELDYAQTLYEKGEIIIFPILYLIEADTLPLSFNWIRKIIYNEINEHSGTLFVVNQIIEKMLHDLEIELPLRSFSEISKFALEQGDNYLHDVTEAYLFMDLNNYSARISFLYSIYLYVVVNKSIAVYDYTDIIVKRIFNHTSLSITLDHLSFNIFRLAVLIRVNNNLILIE